jgi:hypothetical protein
MKVLAPCTICKQLKWFKVDKKTKKPEDKPCQMCKNLMSQIGQRILDKKRKEKKALEEAKRTGKPLEEPEKEIDIKEAIERLIKEQNKPVKIEKPLNIKKRKYKGGSKGEG